MMELTKEQYDKINLYYNFLRGAKYSRNILIPHTSFVKIMEIVYGEHWRNHVPLSVNSCGYCKLDELTKICTMIEDYASRQSKERTK